MRAILSGNASCSLQTSNVEISKPQGGDNAKAQENDLCVPVTAKFKFGDSGIPDDKVDCRNIARTGVMSATLSLLESKVSVRDEPCSHNNTVPFVSVSDSLVYELLHEYDVSSCPHCRVFASASAKPYVQFSELDDHVLLELERVAIPQSQDSLCDSDESNFPNSAPGWNTVIPRTFMWDETRDITREDDTSAFVTSCQNPPSVTTRPMLLPNSPKTLLSSPNPPLEKQNSLVKSEPRESFSANQVESETLTTPPSSKCAEYFEELAKTLMEILFTMYSSSFGAKDGEKFETDSEITESNPVQHDRTLTRKYRKKATVRSRSSWSCPRGWNPEDCKTDGQPLMQVKYNAPAAWCMRPRSEASGLEMRAKDTSPQKPKNVYKSPLMMKRLSNKRVSPAKSRNTQTRSNIQIGETMKRVGRKGTAKDGDTIVSPLQEGVNTKEAGLSLKGNEIIEISEEPPLNHDKAEDCREITQSVVKSQASKDRGRRQEIAVNNTTSSPNRMSAIEEAPENDIKVHVANLTNSSTETGSDAESPHTNRQRRRNSSSQCQTSEELKNWRRIMMNRPIHQVCPKKSYGRDNLLIEISNDIGKCRRKSTSDKDDSVPCQMSLVREHRDRISAPDSDISIYHDAVEDLDVAKVNDPSKQIQSRGDVYRAVGKNNRKPCHLEAASISRLTSDTGDEQPAFTHIISSVNVERKLANCAQDGSDDDKIFLIKRTRHQSEIGFDYRCCNQYMQECHSPAGIQESAANGSGQGCLKQISSPFPINSVQNGTPPSNLNTEYPSGTFSTVNVRRISGNDTNYRCSTDTCGAMAFPRKKYSDVTHSENIAVQDAVGSPVNSVSARHRCRCKDVHLSNLGTSRRSDRDLHKHPRSCVGKEARPASKLHGTLMEVTKGISLVRNEVAKDPSKICYASEITRCNQVINLLRKLKCLYHLKRNHHDVKNLIRRNPSHSYATDCTQKRSVDPRISPVKEHAEFISGNVKSTGNAQQQLRKDDRLRNTAEFTASLSLTANRENSVYSPCGDNTCKDTLPRTNRLQPEMFNSVGHYNDGVFLRSPAKAVREDRRLQNKYFAHEHLDTTNAPGLQPSLCHEERASFQCGEPSAVGSRNKFVTSSSGLTSAPAAQISASSSLHAARKRANTGNGRSDNAAINNAGCSAFYSPHKCGGQHQIIGSGTASSLFEDHLSTRNVPSCIHADTQLLKHQFGVSYKQSNSATAEAGSGYHSEKLAIPYQTRQRDHNEELAIFYQTRQRDHNASDKLLKVKTDYVNYNKRAGNADILHSAIGTNHTNQDISQCNYLLSGGHPWMTNQTARQPSYVQDVPLDLSGKGRREPTSLNRTEAHFGDFTTNELVDKKKYYSYTSSLFLPMQESPLNLSTKSCC